MSRRFWFYSSFAIVFVGLLSWLVTEKTRLSNEISRLNNQASLEQQESLKNYLAHQTDERKLVSLAKRLSHTDSSILKLIIDRAYELNPNSRDITILASFFHPELKKKVIELDPLYQWPK